MYMYTGNMQDSRSAVVDYNIKPKSKQHFANQYYRIYTHTHMHICHFNRGF